ncbi:MAG: DNA repair protein RecO [Alphaproteobacteria bacterium]|nr:DNA repair protein RecO [Alphaproteobacteria bacterium]
MEWTDEAILLSARPHGETAAIVTLLAAQHGCHAGLVPGGQGRRAQSTLQPGNHVKAVWRARLLDHLGNYTLEAVTPHAAPWLDNPEILAIISSACAVTEASLPERQPMPGVYAGLLALLGWPDPALWAPAYVKWETELLHALGYGLDFSKCAVSGTNGDLSHVSPRTGRAVSREAAEPYKNKLFALPGFLCGKSETWTTEDIAQGLDLTGHFLARHVFANPHGRMAGSPAHELPPARERLAEFYGRGGRKG